MTRNYLEGTSRRTFLKGAAATGALAGLGSIALAQERQEYRLGGEIDGWMGRAPSRIEGQTNPSLELEVGQEYAITWENVDGLPHNVGILDREGNVLQRTEIISEQGATQTLQFTASEEMAEYYCEVHPTSMRGQIRFAGQTQTTTAAEEQEPVIPRGTRVGIEQVADGLVSPVGLEALPGDSDRRVILDQIGLMYVHGPDGLREEPFLDLREKLVNVGGREGSDFDERGLLGVAFHPDFRNNRRFYVRYSSPPREGTPDDYDHTSVLSEFQASQDLSRGLIDSERVLLEVPSPQFNHNAGTVVFGPDDLLYFGLGDGGDADDTGLGHVEDWYDRNEGGNGQDTTQNLLGGIHRIDVDSRTGDKPYGIPEDNPFAGDGPNLPEYFAWGLRNPWRIGFSDGRLFAADNGQNLFEEVSVIENGGNYGWNVKEGTHCFSTENPNQPPENCPDRTPDDVRGGEPLIDPVIEYPHTQDGQAVGVSVQGGYVYMNDAVPGIRGQYVFGDYSRNGADPRGRLFAAMPQGGESAAGTETRTATEMGTETTEAAGMGTGAQETTGVGTETTQTGATTTGEEAGDGLWNMQELVVDGSENGELNHFLMGVARDADGTLYALGSETGVIAGETGKVFRIVPPGEGERITTQPTTQATTREGGEDLTTEETTEETTSGETMTGETTTGG